MGQVWVAKHLALELEVAIKFVRNANGYEDPTLFDRFRREAHVTTSIKSQHVVQIFDYGSTPDGTAYIVMELLDGETLARRLSRTGPLSVADARAIAEQTAGVLEKAHALGIVHRDIKPENLVLTRSVGLPVVKVLDFGLAKLSSPDATELTSTGALLGTPAYMSPEQLRNSKDASPLGDLWALAVTLYKVLTGRLPFEAPSSAGVAILVHTAEFAPVHQYRTGLPAGLQPWFERALARDPRQRFGSAHEFASTFADALGGGAQRAEQSAANVRSCLDDEELLSMVAGRLSEREMTAIEQHLDGCTPCCELLNAALAAQATERLAVSSEPASSGPFSAGYVAAHRYRVERCVQRLERGHLYDATDLLLQERVALQTLPVTIEDETLRQLLRDLRTARRIQHPHVCSVYDLYLYEEPRGTCVHFLSSEFVDGESLRDLLRRCGALPIARGVGLLRQVLSGLQAMHAVGLVHRDLRPEKILLREGDSGDVRVSIVQASLGALADTRAQEALRYRAPEQLAGGAVGVGVDFFACGVIASEMLFGRQVMDEARGVAPMLGAIPSRLRRVLETCVESDPERRYHDAGAAAQALGECGFDCPATSFR